MGHYSNQDADKLWGARRDEALAGRSITFKMTAIYPSNEQRQRDLKNLVDRAVVAGNCPISGRPSTQTHASPNLCIETKQAPSASCCTLTQR